MPMQPACMAGFAFTHFRLHCEPMTEQTHHCEHVSVEKNTDAAEVTITAELPAERLVQYRAKALTKLGKEVKVDGFREGHVPENVVLKQVGEERVLNEAANMAITEELPRIMASEDVAAIAAPQVSITKLAEGNALGFTATVPVMPEVTLGDYKKLAEEANKEREAVSVSDDEVEETLTHLRRERAKVEKIEAGTEANQAAKEVQEMETLALPGIDDTFVQSLGYKDAEDFKVKLRENIKTEKEGREREGRRVQIIEKLIEESTVPVPEQLVEHELDKMEAQVQNDMAQSGTSLEEQLKNAGKTRGDVRGEWREAAEKRAKMQLALAEIANKENITANEEDVESHTKHTLSQQEGLNEANVRGYYRQALRNEAVLQWLETLGVEDAEKSDE